MKPRRPRSFPPSPGVFIALCWCALFLSLAAAVDVVIDLVFEEPILAEHLDGESLPEETENITENLLVPSQRADSPASPALVSLSCLNLGTVVAFHDLIPQSIPSHASLLDLYFGSRAAPFLLSLRI